MRRRVRAIGLASVAKVSLLIYIVVGIALVTAALLLTLVSQASGLTAHVDSFARRVLNVKSLSLRPTLVAESVGVFAVVLAMVGVLLHVLVAFVYNRIADLTGGIGVHLGRNNVSVRASEPTPAESVPV